MRALIGFLFILQLAATGASAQSFDVVTDKPFPNDREMKRFAGFVGRSDDNVVQCRAPFGWATYFLHDRSTNQLLLVQHDLMRSADLSETSLDEFRAAVASEKARYETTKQKLLSQPEVSAEFKKRIRDIPFARLPRHIPPVFEVPSSPESGAMIVPDFAALNVAIAAFRAEVVRRGLISEIHTQLLTCAYDFSRLPTRVTNRATQTSIRFVRAAGDRSVKTDWRNYQRTPLREILLNFGHTIEEQEMGR